MVGRRKKSFRGIRWQQKSFYTQWQWFDCSNAIGKNERWESFSKNWLTGKNVGSQKRKKTGLLSKNLKPNQLFKIFFVQTVLIGIFGQPVELRLAQSWGQNLLVNIIMCHGGGQRFCLLLRRSEFEPGYNEFFCTVQSEDKNKSKSSWVGPFLSVIKLLALKHHFLAH